MAPNENITPCQRKGKRSWKVLPDLAGTVHDRPDFQGL